jgi:hypothetical protein
MTSYVKYFLHCMNCKVIMEYVVSELGRLIEYGNIVSRAFELPNLALLRDM